MIAVMLQPIRVQGVHHFAGGIEVGCEIIHAEKRHGGQQADLPGAVDVGIFLLLDRRNLEGKEEDDDQDCD